MFRAIAFRVSLTTRIFKTALTRTLRRLIPGRSNRALTTSEVEFDDLDLAVLRSTAMLGPGHMTSAPELADQLQLRPGLIQGSLDKLSDNKMLDYVISPSDGFETYRLSQSGAYYMAMWLRQEREPRSQTQQR
jgi:DNA-binding MarR family transcriptional regulator